MTAELPYEAGRIKRPRASKADMAARHQALARIVADAAPTGVRFCYYRAVSIGLVPKTDPGYGKVQRAIHKLREVGTIPWESITDSTRWMLKPRSYGSVEEALEDAARSYRQALWRTSHAIVEVWCESKSVAGVVGPVTSKWDVPLFPISGQTSSSFAWSAAQGYRHDRRPVTIYYVGDHDPAGLEIEWNLVEKLRRYSGRQDIELIRLACTPDQVRRLGLIGTAAKKSTAARPDGSKVAWEGPAYEVEAIDAPILRELVEDAILQHVDQHQLDLLQMVEASERDVLCRMAGLAS